MSMFSTITIICLILCNWNQITDGLACYSCVNCNDPFNRNYAAVLYQNDTVNYYCSKSSVGNIVTRSMTLGCTPSGTYGNGQWCCQTDLCNGGMKILTNSFRFVFAILPLSLLLGK